MLRRIRAGHHVRRSRVPRFDRLEGRSLLSGVPAQFTPVGAGGGGSLFSPSFSPYNDGEIYVASDMGQIIHTTNSGATWQDLDFRQVQGSHESLVEYTNDPQTLYTLDYTDPNGDGQVAPTKSTDGGKTWQPLANDPTGGQADKLFVDPSNKNRLILSDFSDLYFSGDGGQTWSTKYTNNVQDAGLHLAGAFWDGSNIDVGSNAGLLVSTNGGASFSVSSVGGIAAGQAMISFSGAKQAGVTRLFAVTWNAGDVFEGVQGYDYGGIAPGSQVIYTLTVGQKAWVPAMTGIGPTVVPIYVGTAQNDINTAYVAGGDNAAGTPTVFKTTNGGASWQSVFDTTNNQNIATGWQGDGGDHGWGFGEVALGFQVAPNNANRVIITDEGFAHDSTDGGATWQALYVVPADRNPAGAAIPRGKAYQESGLDNTTAWGVNFVDASNIIIANTDIGGTHSTDGGSTFAFPSGNSYNTTYMTVTSPGTGIVYAATSSVHDMYESTHLTDSSIDGGTGGVLFSTDKGTTWKSIPFPVNKPVVWLALDPTDPNRLYASVANSKVGGIYVSNNINLGGGATWSKLASPPRTQGHAFNIRVLNDGTLVATFSGRRGGSPVNFTDSSGVFVSSDAGKTWTDVSAPGMHYWTMDLVVDPADPTQSTWYVAVYSGYGGASNNLGGLYRTSNRGKTWTRISDSYRVSSATFNPTDPNELWMTTETQGLWYSDNIQSASPTFTQVASYPFRQPERVFYNPFNPSQLWVTSFGSGVMVGTVPSGGTQNPTSTVVLSSPRATVFGQSETFTATVSATGQGAAPAGSVTFRDGSALLGTVALVSNAGASVASFSTASLGVGTHTITAVYGGSTSDRTSTSPALSFIVSPDKTSTTVTAPAGPVSFGQKETLVATIAALAPGKGTPTGSVTFRDGARVLGTSKVVTARGVSSASLPIASLGVDTHGITAVYSGDGNDAASASMAVTVVVNRDRTKTTVQASSNPVSRGVPVSLVATIAVFAPGAGVPTGTVTFFDGSTKLGTGALRTVKGVTTASLKTATLKPGLHSITVAYNGDKNDQSSKSSALALRVG
jgi:photosystem II stability/assembly factor-like uncharacterized protein